MTITGYARGGVAGIFLCLVLVAGCEGPDAGGPVDADGTDAPGEDDVLYACPKGQFSCKDPKTGRKGPCSDHKSDKLHCGKCGNTCKKGESCKKGVCTAPNPCPVGQFICTDAKGAKGPCSDHKTDMANCGTCGNVCKKTQKCVNGACADPPSPCPPGQFICTDAKGAKGPCSDHKTDVANCGTCGNVCQRTQNCVNGACVTPNPCPPGQFICTDAKGAKGPCSDHKTDMANCGTCGNVCQRTQTCTNGVCTDPPSPCPPGQFICTDAKGAKGPCSDHKTDMANCGTCGNVCSRTQKCVNGACTDPPSPCPPGQFICTDLKGSKGPCSDHLADMANCGTCGNVCSKTQKCVNGVCQ